MYKTLSNPTKIALVSSVVLILFLILLSLKYILNYDFRENREVPVTEQGDIKVFSEIEGVDVSFLDLEGLKTNLDNIDYWDVEGVSHYKSPRAPSTARSVVIDLVGVDNSKVSQPFITFSSSTGNILIAVDTKVDSDGNQHVYVGFSEELIEISDNKELSDWVDSSFWRSIHMSTQYKTSLSDFGLDLNKQLEFTTERMKEGAVFSVSKQ